MKRIVSVLLAMIFIVFSVITSSALSLYEPFQRAEFTFPTVYNNSVDDEITTKNVEAVDPFILEKTGESETSLRYILVTFTSNNPILEPYFNRFGSNDEYYECSDVTNLLYGSGITVFFGNGWEIYDEERDGFYSLDEISVMNQDVIDWILDYLGPQYVGRIGDADKDGELSVIDATEIQRHIAKLSALSNEKIADVDNDGRTDLMDATVLQRNLVTATE